MASRKIVGIPEPFASLTPAEKRIVDLFLAGKRPTEAAHTGFRAFSQKAPDEKAVPLCAACHRTDKDSQTNQSRDWFERNGINLNALVEQLNRTYKTLNGQGETDKAA